MLENPTESWGSSEINHLMSTELWGSIENPTESWGSTEIPAAEMSTGYWRSTEILRCWDYQWKSRFKAIATAQTSVFVLAAGEKMGILGVYWKKFACKQAGSLAGTGEVDFQ